MSELQRSGLKKIHINNKKSGLIQGLENKEMKRVRITPNSTRANTLEVHYNIVAQKPEAIPRWERVFRGDTPIETQSHFVLKDANGKVLDKDPPLRNPLKIYLIKFGRS